jgi:hypothetical protein
MSAGARHGVVLARVAALLSSPRCLSHHLFSFEIQKLKFADATGFLAFLAKKIKRGACEATARSL